MSTGMPFLDAAQLDVIHGDALGILETVGVRMHSDEALDLLRRAACHIDGDLVRIPRGVVSAAIASTPRSWAVFDRAGRQAIEIGAGRTYFGTADVAPWILDHRTGIRRPFALSDTRDAGRLSDALPNIDFVCPFGEPQDVPAAGAAVDAFVALCESTAKPIAFVVPDVRSAQAVIDIAAAVRGNAAALREQPYVFTLLQAISPLSYGNDALEKILLFARQGVPIFIAPAPALGATAPVTIGGALIQSAAEALAGLVIAQLAGPGARAGIGAGISPMDMRHGTFVVGTPEHALANAAFIEYVRWLGLPVWTNGCSSQSKLPDQQAAIEAFVTCYTAALEGADIVYDCGYLETGMMSSLEMLVLMDEHHGFVRRIVRGVDLSDDARALDVIRAVGPGGNYLAEDHTAARFRQEIWAPVLMDRSPYERWVDAGSTSMGERARARIERLLATHAPEPLDPALAARARAIAGGLE